MYKLIIKSFSLIFILSILFYSCSEEQLVQPRIIQNSILFQKTGQVAYASSENSSQSIVSFSTGQVDAAKYKRIKIVFKGFTNTDGSTISLFLKTEKGNTQEIYSASNIGGINQSDHAIEIEEPAEKIWLSIIINMGSTYGSDANIKYTEASDFVIYGIE